MKKIVTVIDPNGDRKMIGKISQRKRRFRPYTGPIVDIYKKYDWDGPFVNFSDQDCLKSLFIPDMKIITSDRAVLYFSSEYTKDIPHFNQDISLISGINTEYKLKVVYSPARFRETNLLLNYLHSKEVFLGVTINPQSAKITYYDISGLRRLSQIMGISPLRAWCCMLIGKLGIVDNELIEYYYENKLDKEEFMKDVVNGKFKICRNVKRQFLSDCYDYGISCGMIKEVLFNILPHYVPTDEQLDKIGLKVIVKYNSATTSEEEKKRAYTFAILQHLTVMGNNDLGNRGIAKFMYNFVSNIVKL
jgi:hypothetical protein